MKPVLGTRRASSGLDEDNCYVGSAPGSFLAVATETTNKRCSKRFAKSLRRDHRTLRERGETSPAADIRP